MSNSTRSTAPTKKGTVSHHNVKTDEHPQTKNDKIQSKQDAHYQATVTHTAGWYIAELDDPQLAVQAEFETPHS